MESGAGEGSVAASLSLSGGKVLKAPQSLLAKKPFDREKPAYEETLVGHITMVCQAADVLTEALGPSLREATLCTESDLLAWKTAVSFAS